jgi:hypothetical protein|tara:strand:+ start:1559 stop:1684 length:126 start_codon:yes stop_codon:yes gene_type:complete
VETQAEVTTAVTGTGPAVNDPPVAADVDRAVIKANAPKSMI